MEQDCWQFWDNVRDDARKGILGIECWECNFKDIIILRGDTLSMKNHPGNGKGNRDFAFECPKCKARASFYQSRKKIVQRKRKCKKG